MSDFQRRDALLQQLAIAVEQLTRSSKRDNDRFGTAIEGFSLSRSSKPQQAAPIVMNKPSLCLTVQGSKWAISGDERYDYGVGQAFVVTIAFPARSAIAEATATNPYLGLVLRLDLAVLRDLAPDTLCTVERRVESARRAFVLDCRSELLNCFLRALHLLKTPDAIAVIYPSIMREICYWLLCGAEREDFITMAKGDSYDQRINRVMLHIQQHFREKLQGEALAKLAGLSQEAFRRRFRIVTSNSPLGYQKHLRLLEGRRLIIAGGESVQQAAYEVGYQSPAHFSRDYSNRFKRTPRTDMAEWSLARET